jgi:hypothetical protein
MAEEVKLNPEAASEVIPLVGASAPVLPAYCRFLRCKEMFIDTGHPFDLADSRSGAYWCAHTQNCDSWRSAVEWALGTCCSSLPTVDSRLPTS